MASIRVELHAEMEDGATYDVAADQRDYAAWEAESFGTPTDQMDRRPTMATRYLAWHALKRTKALTLSWEQFNDTCVQVSSVGDGDGDADPGQPAQSEGP